ncbi:MAG: ribonuclease III [Rhodospirillales bacterium]|nr:ribonuclease III [Rhodospirillales bacterium]
MQETTDDLESVLEHRFADKELLTRALTHTSITKSRSDRGNSYERLEFLGDRVLGLVVARLLFDFYSDEDEGALSRRQTALVRREALVRVAETIQLGRHIVLSHGEADAGGRTNPGILADICEALIAALYLDGGLQAAERFIRSYWTEMMKENLTPPWDAKTELQEWAQGQGLPLPIYSEIEREGPAHAPTFTIEVSVEGEKPISAKGSSKRFAEQEAAGALLEKIRAGEHG